MKDARDIIKRPIITEKSYDLMNEGKFTFEVDKKANKIEVKKACETLFNVKVESVHTINVKPKTKRLGKYVGKTNKRKKAIVKLAEGHKIDLFGEE